MDEILRILLIGQAALFGVFTLLLFGWLTVLPEMNATSRTAYIAGCTITALWLLTWPF